MVSFMWFVGTFSFKTVTIFWWMLVNIWQELWVELIEFHNRIQLWTDDGRDVFVSSDDEDDEVTEES